MKLFSLIILISTQLLYANEYTDLSWVGSLKLPKTQNYQKQLSKQVDSPNLWKTWRTDVNLNVSWLPTKKMKKTPLINVKIISLSQKNNRDLTRKEKRALRIRN